MMRRAVVALLFVSEVAASARRLIVQGRNVSLPESPDEPILLKGFNMCVVRAAPRPSR